MAFCKSALVYLAMSLARVGTRGRARVGIHDIVEVKVEVLLPSMGVTPAN